MCYNTFYFGETMYNSGFIQQGLHNIYYEEHGNPQGIPVVIIHGGPGGSIPRRWKDFFSPNLYHIIFFDQRGCGQSTPLGETKENNLQNIVEDMEALRKHLNISKWHLFGGSWGTTVAISYGLKYPQSCAAFLLRGVFLARKKDIDWFMWDVKSIFPKEHEKLLSIVYNFSGKTPENATELIKFASTIIQDNTNKYQKDMAAAWCKYEMSISTLFPNKSLVGNDTISDYEVNVGKLESYYLQHELPLNDNILEKIKESPISKIPCTIVHGRYDMVCSFTQAHELHNAWVNSKLHIIQSGHYTFDPEMSKFLYKYILSNKQLNFINV